jgi:hypothetical protein
MQTYATAKVHLNVLASSHGLLRSHFRALTHAHVDTRQADVARAELEDMKTLKEASDDRIHMLELNFEELYGQSSVAREEALELKAQRDAARKELVFVCRQLACVRSLLSIFSA